MCMISRFPARLRALALLVLLALAGLLVVPAGALRADPLSALARVDATQSRLSGTAGGAELQLALSQGVPWRAYTLADPPRLVLDFREVDWRGFDPGGLGSAPAVTEMRVGGYRPGWSRMVLALDGPLRIRQAGMRTDDATGRALLSLELARTDAEGFAAASGAPHDPRWDLPGPVVPAMPPRRAMADGPVIVVLDPGHGGIDPGAEYDGITEKELMLTFARELREELRRAGGFEVVMTRDADEFVSLDRRLAIAHAAGAHVFISLHADAVTEGQARGAVVYLLDAEASDEASRQLAERHDRDEILSGVDLSGQDDQIAGILMDLARAETAPRGVALAHALVAGMTEAGGPVNRRAVRMAGFSVLKAADIPSVLVEVGFLSSPRDVANLTNPHWRAGMAAGIRAGLQHWVAEDLARAALRQR